MRIPFLNERDLFGPRPTFELFLARNGGFDVMKQFVVDELVDFVLLGEAFEDAVFMLPHPARQIARQTDIKTAGMAAHDVDPTSLGYHREKKIGPSTRLGELLLES